MKKIDILSVGELLIDMMSADFADTMDTAELFKRLPGGSPANLCMNMKRLGKNAQLVATLGTDDMGNFLHRYVKNLGLETSTICQTSAVNTTMILVTRSREVSNFEAYRGADSYITDEQLSDALLSEVNIFHTTCFALSKQPARDAILRGVKKVIEMGGKASIDVNYAQKIGPTPEEARSIVAEYCAQGAMVKCSEVDWERLYGSRLTDPESAAKHFLNLGAAEVCITMGGEGLFVASNTEGGHFLPTRPIEVKDTTGAGDAFWSGYLTARLDGYGIFDAAKAGRKMAETKLGVFGQLPQTVDKTLIYSDLD